MSDHFYWVKLTMELGQENTIAWLLESLSQALMANS